VLKKVVHETRQTSSETIPREFRCATNCRTRTMTVRRELRGMGFHGRTAAHNPNISPVNAKRRLKWCKERRHWTVDNWKRVIWGEESHCNMWRSDGRVRVWRMPVRASMCSANSEIWRRWHYSVEVFFMEWTWPSRNTVWKSKRGRIQGHFDPVHTVYRSLVMTSVSA
jgi:hypothetical protein